MASKRKSRSTAKASQGRKVRVNRQDIDSPLAAPVEMPSSVDPAADDAIAASGSPKLPSKLPPKAGPVVRGGGFTGIGRSQGAPQARRYAFRRS